jgi:hypothetical protein
MMLRLLREFSSTFLVHAVAAHFSNGLVPTAILFLVLARLTATPCLDRSVFYLSCVTLVMIPVSFWSGILDWKGTFRGAKAPVFIRKIRLSLLFFALAAGTVLLLHADPGLLSRPTALAWLCRGCLFGMLPTVILLGHYGGKLAHQARKNRME